MSGFFIKSKTPPENSSKLRAPSRRLIPWWGITYRGNPLLCKLKSRRAENPIIRFGFGQSPRTSCAEENRVPREITCRGEDDSVSNAPGRENGDTRPTIYQNFQIDFPPPWKIPEFVFDIKDIRWRNRLQLEACKSSASYINYGRSYSASSIATLRPDFF